MLFVSRLFSDRCTHAKMDAAAVGLPVSASEPKTRTRVDTKMILKIGQVVGSVLDNCFLLFSAKRIKEQSTKRKLMKELNKSMAEERIQQTDSTLVIWLGKFWKRTDAWEAPLDREQKNGLIVKSGADNEACNPATGLHTLP